MPLGSGMGVGWGMGWTGVGVTIVAETCPLWSTTKLVEVLGYTAHGPLPVSKPPLAAIDSVTLTSSISTVGPPGVG